jgi:hypothetical protein
MSFTRHNDLEIQSSGQADWDTGLRSNFQILERGLHFKAQAGATVSSGQIIVVQSDGLARPYDSRSLDLRPPSGMSYKSVTSGDEAIFVAFGVIGSLSIWSGNIIPGEPVFCAPNSLGWPARSYSAAGHPVGIALSNDTILVQPRPFAPEMITTVLSGGIMLGASSAWNFAIDIGQRGFVRQLRFVVNSNNAHKIQFWSGSARVSSELLYETLTTSVDGGASDYDVKSLNFLDGAGWPYRGTDTSSPGLIFGRVTVQSITGVGSDFGHFRIIAERLR